MKSLRVFPSRRFFAPLLVALIGTFVGSAAARQWDVGASRSYTLPSQVSALVANGDTVNIDAGSYVDCATWTRSNLLLRGVGGYAHLHDKACGGKAIWVLQGSNTTVEWIEFSGATVVDQNGAGIRQEGPNLTVRYCRFHDNDEGILAGDNAASVILIEYSEFGRNGYGDGYSHNMYINHIARFTLRYCYVHHAKIGHDVKSRAYETYILCNRISDERDGTASRCIDLPNGGYAVVMGNLIHHGPNAQNSNVFEFGLEGLTNPRKRLVVSHNTFVNERGSGTFIQLASPGVDTLYLVNNLFVGAGSIMTGTPGFQVNDANTKYPTTAAAELLNPAAYDYHLLSSSPAIDAGNALTTSDGLALVPDQEYVHPANWMPRPLINKPDIGAFEYSTGTGVDPVPGEHATAILLGSHPNPFTCSTTIRYAVSTPGGTTIPVRLRVVDVLGRVVATLTDGQTSSGIHSIRFDADVAEAMPRLLMVELTTPSARRMMRLLRLR
jgi:hypothetical protein